MKTAIAKPGSITHSRRTTLKILLVDDDKFQLEAVSEILRDLGFANISVASSGAMAIESITSKHEFDLIVTDLHMPGMDGFLFMEQLAGFDFTGALIIMSGQNGNVMHAASLVARLRRFTLLGLIPKPANRTALSEMISKLIDVE